MWGEVERNYHSQFYSIITAFVCEKEGKLRISEQPLPCKESRLGPPKYKTGMLTTQPQHPISEIWVSVFAYKAEKENCFLDFLTLQNVAWKGRIKQEGKEWLL